MHFDILRFLEKTHPMKIIFVGMFLISVGLNILQHKSNIRLVEELNKKSQPKIFILPKPNFKQQQDPNKDFITRLNLKGGGVKVSTTVSELYKQVVVDRQATLKVD